MKIKWRAILHMTISYIPWIIYWTLSAFSLKLAPIVSLVAAAMILILRFRKRSFALMDLVMFFYSIVAVFFNYFTKKEWFLTGDGYMGYGVLFLMSVISIIMKKPFAMYYVTMENLNVSKKIKQQVAYKISFIWMFVFIISTIIFIVITVPVFAVAASNFFVVIGIVSSVYVISVLENKGDL